MLYSLQIWKGEALEWSFLHLTFENLNKQIFLNEKWNSSAIYRNESKEIVKK